MVTLSESGLAVIFTPASMSSLLADASEFVYQHLKRFERELMASFQAKWSQHNVVKVTVVPHFNNQDVCDAIALGGMLRVFRREKT